MCRCCSSFALWINILKQAEYGHFLLQKVTLWKKVYVIYSFFFVRKIIAHINNFLFFCIALPATVVVPEVAIPRWGGVYIPTATTIINAIGTPKYISSRTSMDLHIHKFDCFGMPFQNPKLNWVVVSGHST